MSKLSTLNVTSLEGKNERTHFIHSCCYFRPEKSVDNKINTKTTKKHSVFAYKPRTIDLAQNIGVYLKSTVSGKRNDGISRVRLRSGRRETNPLSSVAFKSHD